MTDIMTPAHVRWNVFIGRLGQDLEQCGGCSGDGTQLDLETGETAPQKHPTHWLSRRLLAAMDCDVEASLAYFREHGGYCDCEVIYNVHPPVRETEERREPHDHQFGSDPDCPGCNAHAVFSHFMRDDVQIRSIDDQPLTSTENEGGDNLTCTCDFGVLAVSWTRAGYTVWSLGETVMTVTPDSVRTREGPWIAMLASIRMMLDASFGPPSIEPLTPRAKEH
jgi:hypothetical protein